MWTVLLAVLVLGYLLFGRSFAYLGIPSLGVFVGETSLALFAVARPRALLGRWAGAILDSTRLAMVGWTLLAFVSYGMFEAARGFVAGYPPMRVMQTFAFCVYPLFVFLGVHVGLERPGFLDRLLRVLVWAGGIWGVAYVLWLNGVPWEMPNAPGVQLLGIGGATSVALVGLFTSATPLGRSAIPILLNALALSGMLLRARWLGVAAALLVVGVLRGKLRRVVGAALVGAAILGAAFVLDVELPAPRSRGGTFSAREIAARMIAIVDPAGAEALGTATGGSSGTVEWRLELWSAVWNDIHRDLGSALLGWGHGRPLDDIVPFVRPDLRSPHSSVLFALGYTGWIGVAVFLMFELALLELMWGAFRAGGNAFGVACWVLHMVVALFGNVLETPFNAIPFYLLVGLAATPLLSRGGDSDASAARP